MIMRRLMWLALAALVACSAGPSSVEPREAADRACQATRSVCDRVDVSDPTVARGICTLALAVCDLIESNKDKEGTDAMPTASPRVQIVPALRQPHTMKPGTSGNADEKSSQKIAITSPVVGIRIAADSQLDVVDLWPDGEIGEPLNLRNRIRVSAESPWFGRMEKGDLIATPVRAFDVTNLATYPDQTPSTVFPMLKLEFFECTCKGECEGHAPPLPHKLAPMVMLEGASASALTNFRYRIPGCGRELVTVALAFSAYTGAAAPAFTITGVDFAQERGASFCEDIETPLATVAAAASGTDYTYQYAGTAFDEIRVHITNAADTFTHYAKLEAK